MLKKLAANHPNLFLLGSYIGLVLAVTLTLFWRFPNNVMHANFYAEDGSVFLQNVLDKGWLGAAFTPFNGYMVWGLYLLEGFGWLLNLVFGSSLLSLPGFFALAAIIFMATILSLPYLLFGTLFGRLKMLVVVIFGALLPLPLSPHVVIGTIGNQKWIFFYLAFLLVLYRIFRHKQLSLPKVLVIDAALLICAYTNSTTYALVPLLFMPYLQNAWQQHKKSLPKALLTQLRRYEVLSLIGLCVLLLPQVIYVSLHGIPAIPGYLDTPYKASRTIEVFGNRSLLFGLTHIVNGYLNDWLVLIMLAVLIGLAINVLRGRAKITFFVGIYAALVASALFVINRPGITDFFMNYDYSGSGPDQFFYTQTLIMYLPLVLVVFAAARLLPWYVLRNGAVTLFVLLVIASGLISNVKFGEPWRNASVFENATSTFIDQSLKSCTQHKRKVSVILYPYESGQFQLTAPFSLLCNHDLNHYQTAIINQGISPQNNNYRVIDRRHTFQQRFQARHDGLEGIGIFFSTFNNAARSGTYQLTIYNESCSTGIRHISIPERLYDNAYYNARFVPIDNSAGKVYCFSLLPPAHEIYDPLAVQVGNDSFNATTRLSLGKTSPIADVVFKDLYTQTKR